MDRIFRRLNKRRGKSICVKLKEKVRRGTEVDAGRNKKQDLSPADFS